MSGSVLRRAPASRAFGAALLAALLFNGPLCAQQERASLIVIDVQRALRETDLGAALRARETQERAALQDSFDATQAELEAREQELQALRAEASKAEFEPLAAAFDQRVRRERRAAQEQGAALRERFERAQAAFAARIRSEAAALARARGAEAALDSAAALYVRAELDGTDALIARLNQTMSAREVDALLGVAP